MTKREKLKEFEGKEITFFDGVDTIEAIVVGCDYDVGLTIMTKDKTRYLLCLHGPATTRYKNWHYAGKRKLYRVGFFSAIAQIRKGHFNSVFDDKIDQSMGRRAVGPPSANTCPFS